MMKPTTYPFIALDAALHDQLAAQAKAFFSSLAKGEIPKPFNCPCSLPSDAAKVNRAVDHYLDRMWKRGDR